MAVLSFLQSIPFQHPHLSMYMYFYQIDTLHRFMIPIVSATGIKYKEQVYQFTEKFCFCFYHVDVTILLVWSFLECEDNPAIQCILYNKTRVCNENGIYAPWAKENCRAYCGYCQGNLYSSMAIPPSPNILYIEIH